MIVADHSAEGTFYYRRGRLITKQTAKHAARNGTPVLHVENRRSWVERNDKARAGAKHGGSIPPAGHPDAS